LSNLILSWLYFKLIIPIIFVFLALSLTARSLGSTQPPNLALRGFVEGCEDKPQPCWYGIVPGVTNLPVAEQAIIHQGYQIGSNFSDISFEFIGNENEEFGKVILWRSENYVESISLLYPTHMRLGDALAILGKSSGVSSIFHDDTVALAYPDETFSITSYWNKVSYHERDSVAFLLTVHSVNPPPPLHPWHGIVPKWRYCQLEPNFRGCSN
jgi:hypothetical protein